MPEKPERNRAFDRAKGVGAVLVVLIHATPLIHSSVNGLQVGGWLIREVCQIAVPFFFILSGWLLGLKWDAGRRDWNEVVRSAIRLLRLYVPWFTVFLFLDIVSGRAIVPFEIVRRLFGFSVRMADITGYHLWFLPCLILAQFASWGLARASKGTTAGLVAGSCLFAALYAFEMSGGALPWSLDLTEGINLSFPCVSLGMYLSSHRTGLRHLTRWNPLFLLAPLFAEGALQLLVLPGSGPVHVFQVFRVLLPAVTILSLSQAPQAFGKGQAGTILDMLARHSTAIYVGHMAFISMIPFDRLVSNGFLRDNILRWTTAVAGSIALSMICRRSPWRFARSLVE